MHEAAGGAVAGGAPPRIALLVSARHLVGAAACFMIGWLFYNERGLGSRWLTSCNATRRRPGRSPERVAPCCGGKLERSRREPQEDSILSCNGRPPRSRRCGGNRWASTFSVGITVRRVDAELL